VKKVDDKNAHRTAQAIHDELQGAELTAIRLRRLLEKCMAKIRSPRFTEYVIGPEGKKVRNPVLKSVREYEGTLRSVSRHMAALKAEENSLLGSQQEKSDLDEFAVETK
jgi:hypothetical protein